MGICFDHIYFRPKISAACFKISFSILNCWFSFRSRISSSCSGVRLSFSWKEPELDACFTHLSNREVAMSYSRQISHLRLPERYSSTSCCLNSSVYLRGQDTATVEIKVNDGKEIKNELIYGSVSGKKIDENGEALEGAVIGIFKAEETEFTKDTALMTTTSAKTVVFLLQKFLMANGL